MSDDHTKRGYFRSGELARSAGVSPDTLRHYERKGLLGRLRRSANGYREYPVSALDRVNLVRRALGVGFTLDELARILGVRDGGGAPCQQVRALAGKKLTEVQTRLAELTELRDELEELLKNWDVLLTKNPAPGRAGLLESLASGHYRRSIRSPLHGQAPRIRKKGSKETQW